MWITEQSPKKLGSRRINLDRVLSYWNVDGGVRFQTGPTESDGFNVEGITAEYVDSRLADTARGVHIGDVLPDQMRYGTLKPGGNGWLLLPNQGSSTRAVPFGLIEVQVDDFYAIDHDAGRILLTGINLEIKKAPQNKLSLKLTGGSIRCETNRWAFNTVWGCTFSFYAGRQANPRKIGADVRFIWSAIGKHGNNRAVPADGSPIKADGVVFVQGQPTDVLHLDLDEVTHVVVQEERTGWIALDE